MGRLSDGRCGSTICTLIDHTHIKLHDDVRTTTALSQLRMSLCASGACLGSTPSPLRPQIFEELRGRGATSSWSCRQADGRRPPRSLCYFRDDATSQGDQPALG